MTVGELIRLLETFPHELTVIAPSCSEYRLVEAEHISTVRAQEPRADGWIHDTWKGQPVPATREYLCLP